MNVQIKQAYLAILKEELIPAMGCTEPIALAYASAKAKELLGATPEQIVAHCSGNMIKNVRCVQIPNSGGMQGIETAVVLGAVGGDATRNMEVLEAVTPQTLNQAKELLKNGICTVAYLDSEIPLHFIIEATAQKDTVMVEVMYSHLNIVTIKKNGEVLHQTEQSETHTDSGDRSLLTMEGIKTFADEIELHEIKSMFDRQIQCNMDIAYEGISGEYGVNIGKIIRNCYGESTVTRMKAYAAAASEARMGGCDMPVIINSGSGNQGIASSVPVIVYARENNIPEATFRAWVKEENNELIADFTDGRHRFCVIRDLGAKDISVALDTESFELARKYGLM